MASAVSHQHGKITDAQLMAQLDEQRTKLEFELHLSHITEMHKAFFDNMSKVSGFLLLALGWFATSKDARAYLASEPTLSTLAAIGVLAAYLLSVAAAVVAYRASRLALQRLNELNFLPASAYVNRALLAPTFLVCTLGNGVLAGLLVIAIFRLNA